MYIGEPFYISNIYNIINKVKGVIDVKDVMVNIPTAAGYSSPNITIADMLSADGTYINPPLNVVFEIKDYSNSIRGVAQ